MPNRILRDWTDSLSVDTLSRDAECFFVRLIMKADDFGRFHGDDRLLKANLFPLMTDLCPSSVRQWCDECAAAGLIHQYEDGRGRKFIMIRNFDQRTRAKKSKFPPPPDMRLSNDCHMRTETETETIYGDGGGDDARERRDAAGAAEVDMEEIDRAAGPHRPKPIPYREIVDAFNEILGNRYLKTVMYATGTRKDEIARLWNFLEEEMDHILAYWLRVSRSHFLIGRLPGKSFKASFDWLLNVDHAAKVLEGQYDNERRQG